MKTPSIQPQPAAETRHAWRDFDRIAPGYEQENLMLEIEAAIGEGIAPSPRGKRLLDLGCGTSRWARWLLQEGAAGLVQLDRSSAMLQRARQVAISSSQAWPVRADMNELPLATESLDGVLASLCLSYTHSLERVFSEIARCLSPGGFVYLSDVHPESEQLGWRRNYPLPDGNFLEPPYCVHRLADYRDGLARCGLTVSLWNECFINQQLHRHFERAGHMRQYRRWFGAPLLLFAVAEKTVAR